MKNTVGGGPKKVLYTLNTLRRIGLKNSAKALRANNACKACGLGMGGQRGGMVNELGEFPAVCNKSVQAQSTDIQAPIPPEVFQHSFDELKELTPRELEHLGRLAAPLYKSAEADRFQVVDWQWAIAHAAKRFAETAAENSFFYASGRSSNEAGFVLQLLARLYGTNNVNNCSYYCHQATGVGLAATIGTGTATVELEDLSGCDLIFVIGANPASNHPRFIHKLKACRDRGGQVIVINPAKEPGLVKFAVPKSPASLIAGGTEIASLYLQPNIGGDIALFKGLMKVILREGWQDTAFIHAYCEGSEACFSDIEALSWADIEQASGLSQAEIERAAKLYSQSQNTVFAWGMGMTHHQFGVQNVEYISNLALLRGMLGRRFAGLLPLRGHSNVQGIGTIGVKPVLAEQAIQQLEAHLNVELPKTAGLDTYNALRKASEGHIHSACIMGGNLYAATPNSAWAAQALNKISFKLFLTTTLNQGHLYGLENSEALILPVLARDEEQQPTTQESMFNYVRLSDGGIHRIDGARSEVSILTALGSRLVSKESFDFAVFNQHQSIREAIAASIPGMSQLKDIGVAKREFHVQGRIKHTPRFHTPSGKARFVFHPLPNGDIDTEEFPLRLATVRSEGQFNSIIYEEHDSYRQGATREAILLSPADIRELNLVEGQRVTVSSAFGEMKNAQVTCFDLPQGSCMAYYPEANALTGNQLDPRSFTPNFKSIAVKITP